ncbi:MAG: DUF4258 domain-containing protein [Dehalococcoidia bacterium]|nr:DUF4258 domain-containing protein [Dehalococcoidia bacterium]
MSKAIMSCRQGERWRKRSWAAMKTIQSSACQMSWFRLVLGKPSVKKSKVMQFDYTDHAEENIGERGLSKQVIESAVTNPDEVVEGSLGRKIAHKMIGTKLLRVVYGQQGNVLIIVTAYYAKPERYR